MTHPNGQSVAKVLIKEVIPLHGIPSVIYSDNGSHFVNRTIQQIDKWYNIDLKKTTVSTTHNLWAQWRDTMVP